MVIIENKLNLEVETNSHVIAEEDEERFDSSRKGSEDVYKHTNVSPQSIEGRFNLITKFHYFRT